MNFRKFLLLSLTASILLGQSVYGADNNSKPNNPNADVAAELKNEEAEFKKLLEALIPRPPSWRDNIKPAAMAIGGITLGAYIAYKIHKKAQTEEFEERHPYLKYFIDKMTPWISWTATIAAAVMVPKKLQAWGFVSPETAVLMSAIGMTSLATKAQGDALSLTADDIQPLIPSTKMKDLAGEKDPAIIRLKEYLESQEIRKAYKQNKTALYKGILLYGPPGTGKTLTAKAIAGQAGVSFFAASVAELENKWLGESPKKIKNLFKKAKEEALWNKKGIAIIFLDEIDAIASNRSTSHEAHRSMLSTLLSEMDGVRPCNNVIVIACTNMPQDLDPAITRPGRFDKVLTVDLPNKEQRAAILDLYLAKKESYEHHYDRTKAENDLDGQERTRKTATQTLIKKLVSVTEGASAATLKEIIEEASRRAIHTCFAGNNNANAEESGNESQEEDEDKTVVITDELIEQVAEEMAKDPIRGTRRDGDRKRAQAVTAGLSLSNGQVVRTARDAEHDRERKQLHSSAPTTPVMIAQDNPNADG